MSEENKPAEKVTVQGEVVNVTSPVQQVIANTVNLTNSGAGAVKGERVTVSVNQGGIGAVLAQQAEVSVTGGAVGVVMGQDVKLSNATVSLAMARQISGDAKILFDMRAGLVMGLVIGAVIAVLKALAPALKRRCNCD